MLEKVMQKWWKIDAKMEPKWEPKSIKNQKIKIQKGIQKLMPKIDADSRIDKNWILSILGSPSWNPQDTKWRPKSLQWRQNADQFLKDAVAWEGLGADLFPRIDF